MPFFHQHGPSLTSAADPFFALDPGVGSRVLTTCGVSKLALGKRTAIKEITHGSPAMFYGGINSRIFKCYYILF